MTSRASSTTTKPAKKAAAKKKAARSGPVEVKKPPLRDQLHPGILASALDLADGDARRIEVLSYGSVMVTVK